MNETIRIIKSRRSIRSYEDIKIPHNVLKELADCGRLAPTAKNIQPWEFIIITEKDMLEKIGSTAEFGTFTKNAAACIAVCSKDCTHFLEDSCAATENILIAAESMKIGACWVAGHGKKYSKEIKKLLKIPDNIRFVSLIVLGYPKDSPPKITKRKPDDVLHWQVF
ncbi:MAG: nitroreductase family protein [archaeon]|nr:nitroreductase family protein [archaeon]